jgi:hypothetical protein
MTAVEATLAASGAVILQFATMADALACHAWLMREAAQ